MPVAVEVGPYVVVLRDGGTEVSVAGDPPITSPNGVVSLPVGAAD